MTSLPDAGAKGATAPGAPALVRSRPDAAHAPHSPGRVRRPLPLSLLLGLLTVAALLPFFALSASTLLSRVEAQRTAEFSRLDQLAADLAAAVDRELRGHIETAKVLTGSRHLQEGDIRAFWAHAEDAARQADGHFVLIDRNHRQLVNTRRPIGSWLPMTAEPDGVDEVFASGRTQVGNLAVGSVAQQQLFAVRIPVRVGAEVAYVLAYIPRADAIAQVVNESYRPSGWRASVMDGNGVIIARSHRHDEFFGKPVDPAFFARVTGTSGRMNSVDLEGRASITAYRALNESEWTTLVWAPQALLEQPAREAERLLLILMTLVLAITLVMAYGAGRLIREPLTRLLEAARDLGSDKRVVFAPSMMREANIVGEALAEAQCTIKARETALFRSEANLQIVLREMTHRSKNLLTVIQALAARSSRSASDFDQFRTSFEARLAGLARSHDLLVQENWSNVPLDKLVQMQTSPFISADDGRLSTKGPPLLLKPEAAQSLGMAFHELATNATKYGALSVPTGRIAVSWERWTGGDGTERVVIRWEEFGGPSPSPATEKGFGSLVIEKIAPAQLDGSAAVIWRPEGLMWRCEAPLGGLVQAAKADALAQWPHDETRPAGGGPGHPA